ncbi:MAG: 50S ribosomal protein L15 [Saprospiraceae bacterium]|nr:50S ribosomal protein L15 [Saprospiraceae bacterium]
MELHNLKPAKGSTKQRKRIARGPGSGRGGTSTRGHKGAKSRAGYKRKRAFEGGQMPLQMRLPKIGFKSPNRKEYATINLDQLQSFAEKYNVSDITSEVLVDKGVASKNDLIKILGRGKLEKKLNVTVHAYSASAKAAIEANGGSVEVI